ncbi:MAG: hypothetical protein TUN42_06655 [Dehalogenimonas sp.]
MTENRTSVQTLEQSNPPKRRRGAPKGNTNARSHGLYSRKSFEANMVYLKENTDLGRADCEIFLAMWQVKEIALRFPTDQAMYDRAFKRFFKLVKRRFGVASDREVDKLEFALDQVERDIVLPPERLAEITRHLV